MIQPIDIGQIVLTAQQARRQKEAIKLQELQRQALQGEMERAQQLLPGQLEKQQFELRNLGLTGDKTRAETRNKRAEFYQKLQDYRGGRRKQTQENQIVAAQQIGGYLDGLEAGTATPQDYMAVRDQVFQTTGIELPQQFDVGTLRQMRGAGVSLMPDDRPVSIREFEYAQDNPEFDAREIRMKRAGATRIENNVGAGPNGGTVSGFTPQEEREFRIGIADAEDVSANVDRILGNTDKDLFTFFSQGKDFAGALASKLGVSSEQAERDLSRRQRLTTSAAIQILQVAKPLLGALSEGERAFVTKTLGDPSASSYPEFVAAMRTVQDLAKGQISRNKRRLELGGVEIGSTRDRIKSLAEKKLRGIKNPTIQQKRQAVRDAAAEVGRDAR